MLDIFADFALVPLSWWLGCSFVLGIIIGSFLNVYIYRLNTGRSLKGSSHCLSCDKPLRWYELFPLLSYLFLRGRCSGCGSWVPVRYFLVELLTGLLFMAVTATFLPSVFLIFLGFWLMSVLVIITVYDLYHMIIPDRLVVILLVIASVAEFYALVTGLSALELLYNALAASAGVLFLFALWSYSKGRWLGFGDVKLVFPLGLLVGYSQVFSMLVLAFWVGAIVSLLILGLQKLKKRGQIHLHFLGQELTIKSEVPFAPFLIAGFLLVYFWSVDVISLITYVP